MTVGRKKTSTRFVFLDTFANYPADFDAVFSVQSDTVSDWCENYEFGYPSIPEVGKRGKPPILHCFCVGKVWLNYWVDFENFFLGTIDTDHRVAQRKANLNLIVPALPGRRILSRSPVGLYPFISVP